MACFLLSHSSVMDAKSARRCVSLNAHDRFRRHGTRRLRGILVSAAIVSLSLTACAIPRDSRTQAEKDRDAEIWTQALSMQVVNSRNQLTECKELGVVTEQYFEDVPSDPMKRSAGMAWPEHMLRFKTAQLGGNAALMNTPIDRWKQDDLVQSRVLGEAWSCHQPTIATR
jgi:hypothetical protein